MTDPTPTPTVTQALVAAAIDVGPVPKDDYNTDQGFAFRGIERILAAAGPALHKHGILTLPTVVSLDRAQKERGAQRNLWDHVTLTVEYRFVGPAGDALTATVMSEGLDNGDKAVSKAMTMAYKTALLQVLGIGDDTHDPDHSGPAEGPVPRAASRPAGTTKKAPAKKAAAPTAKKAAAPRSTADVVRPLIALHGGRHATEVMTLIDAMGAIADGGTRKAVKAEFVDRFGQPTELAPGALPDAKDWLTGVLAPAGDERPGDGNVGASAGTCEVCGAEGADHVTGCPEDGPAPVLAVVDPTALAGEPCPSCDGTLADHAPGCDLAPF